SATVIRAATTAMIKFSRCPVRRYCDASRQVKKTPKRMAAPMRMRWAIRMSDDPLMSIRAETRWDRGRRAEARRGVRRRGRGGPRPEDEELRRVSAWLDDPAAIDA